MARRRKTVAITVLLLALVVGGGLFALGRLGLPEFALDNEPATGVQQAATTPPAEHRDAEKKGIADTKAPETKAADAEDDDKATFDIAKISPDGGTSVFAGQAEPNSIVSLTEDGKPVATTKADENGEWSMMTGHKFASADPEIGLETRQPTEQDKLAAATPPSGAAEQNRPRYAPDQLDKNDDTPAPPQNSSKAVTDGMMRNLEGLVAEARKEAEKPEKESGAATAPATEPKTEMQTAEQSPAPPPAAPEQPAKPDTPAAKTEMPVAKTEEAEKPAATTPPAQSDKLAAATSAAPPQASVLVPVPIMFVYREATFTDEGKRAAGLLLEYLKLKKFDNISLSGHADERGTDELNYDLSKDRLDTVEEFLRDGGYTGKLRLVPKGKLEPYSGVDRTKFSQDELYQLDRRVELHITQ